MDCRALAFRQLPHQPKIFLDYLDHFSRTKSFYAHEPTMKSLLREAKSIEYLRERAQKIAQVLGQQNTAFGSDAATQKNIERLAKGAVAVVSGQQVGLFGGPSYSVYKALMAVQVARELTREGVDAVPSSGWPAKTTTWTKFATPLGFTMAAQRGSSCPRPPSLGSRWDASRSGLLAWRSCVKLASCSNGREARCSRIFCATATVRTKPTVPRLPNYSPESSLDAA